MARLAAAVLGWRRPIRPPSTGTKTRAIEREAASVRMTVIGRNFMNSPIIPVQNRSGKNTDSVVAVDATMGQAMRFAASA